MLKIKFHFGLRSKSVLLTLLSATVFILFFLLYAIPEQDKRTTKSLIKASKQHLHTLSIVVVSPLLKRQYAYLYEELDSHLHENKQWKSLRLTTTEGFTIYPLLPKANELAQGDILIETDIVFLDKTLGKLTLIANITKELEEKHQQQYQVIIMLLAILFCILLTMILFIEKTITRPLAKLTQAFRQLSEHNFNYQLPAKKYDEVGQVISAFKSMRTKVHTHQIETSQLYQSERLMLEEIRQSEQHLRLYQEQSPIATVEWDIDGHVIDWNKTAEKLFGYGIEEARGRCFIDFIVDSDRLEPNTPLWSALLQQQDIVVTTMENLTKEGRIIICEWHNTTLKDKSGAVLGVASLILDITERKQVEEKLLLSSRVFNQTHEGIIITDAKGIITDVNPSFCKISGYSPEEAIGQNPRFLNSGKQGPAFYKDMWQSINEQGYWQGEIWNVKKNGELFAQLTVISALYDSEGQLLHYVGLFSDITQSMLQQESLEHMAHYDVLTNLPNRTLFADRFSQAIAYSKRNKSLLAVCFLDLDGFKPINDSYGHDAGDQILIEVGERIKKCVREQDTVSRLGGDEFALLLGGMSTVEQCKFAMSRVHQAIAQPYAIEDDQVTVGASSGLTIYPEDNADPDTLLRHADQSMYQAKQEGRNRYKIFDTQYDQEISKKQSTLEVLETALLNNELCLYYQPKVNMKSGDVVGAEALIRWIHPERGIIPPLDFLPHIENTELEIRIGNWVLEEALKQLSAWTQQHIALEISINISSFHLMWSGFSNHLDNALSRYPEVLSHQLQLEVLESSVLTDINIISRVINNCRDTLGVSFALDDFGTGYSSLTHLRRLHVDVIKIDQSFIRDMLDDPEDYEIVKGVIGLAFAFNRQLIAEGVETEEHGRMLMLMNCFHAQGYGIARPMPAKDLEQWITTYQPYTEWSEFASEPVSQKKILIQAMSIENKQWLKHMQESVYADDKSTPHWPIQNSNKCLFSRWSLIASQEGLFDQKQFEQLQLKHEKLHRLGKQLKAQFDNGEIEKAQSGLQDLYSIHTDISNILDNL